MQIKEKLIKCVESKGSSATIEIDAKKLEHYKSIVDSLWPMLSVACLKQYISLNGKSGVKETARVSAVKTGLGKGKK